MPAFKCKHVLIFQKVLIYQAFFSKVFVTMTIQVYLIVDNPV
jgi:hypothetical protein